MKILIESDGSTYRLMVNHPAMEPMPAGPRLFRAPPHPAIKWEHDTMESAQADAATLRAYLASHRKGPSEKALREQDA